jgi:GntR family transcriptional regulator/MocR family aminotransferase
LLPLADRSRGALHAQLERGLREAIREGRLRAGAPLPSTRTLAGDLGISRGVVVEAYEQLTAEGFLTTRPRGRTVVAGGTLVPRGEVPIAAAGAVRFDFRPGLPELRHFPREELSRAARAVFRQLRPQQLAYGEPAGLMDLRQPLGEYLSRVRGVVARPAQVIVCTGFTQALVVAARTLARRGVRRVAMEDPGHPDQRRLVVEAGLEPVPIPVDELGLRVDLLARSRARAVVVTPAHQFPRGCVLDPRRRRDLLDWAATRDGFVIEDDYDAEYRYDRSPVGALQGLAPARVLYAGSASKSLAPALRLGWLVMPDALLATASEVKKLADLGTPSLEQLIYADLMHRGGIDRHLRRMRGLYRRRRDALLRALDRHCPGWAPQGAAAGLHLLVELPAGSDERALAQAAEQHSVRVYPCSDYRTTSGPPALVLGYACLSEREIGQGVALLAGCYATLPPAARGRAVTRRRQPAPATRRRPPTPS